MAFDYDTSFLTFFKKGKEGMETMANIKTYAKRNEKTMECSNCGHNMELLYSPKYFPYTVGDTNKELRVTDTPYHKCNICGKEVESLLLYAEMEKAIEEELFIRLNKREAIPEEIDFSAFL